MMIALGIVVGFILGALALGWSGALAGAFTGFIVMLAWRSRSQALAREAARRAAAAALLAPAPGVAVPAARDPVAVRLAAIEARLAALEQRVGLAPDVAAALPELREATVREAALDATLRDETALAPAGTPDGFIRTLDGTLEPVARTAPSVVQGNAPSAVPTPSAAADVPPEPVPPSRAPNPVWAWITGGNLLTRVGVIALFVGVGFLLRYLAEFVTVPIGLRLAGVAAAGAALAVLGARLVRTRPGYGVSLEGAGMGVLYLTAFAALRLYDVLDPRMAFALLVAVSALTVFLAARADSQPLAGLAVAGGFLAPFLVATSAGEPALLLGYFLVLNVAVLALALVKSWRALNVLGFAFTFVLGAFWGHRFYRPEHFATVEPFLVAFFLFYLAIAILYARRAPLRAAQPVDGLLVFGVPLVGFALQAALLRDTRYGVAISAFALAALYALLAGVLRRRSEPGFPLLAQSFVVLAVIFLTTAVPFAVDPQWTTAWWALEAAAVYWIGCRQRQRLARGFALLLQLGAALAFVAGAPSASGPLFMNAVFLGGILVALAALATAWAGDRHREDIGALEGRLPPFLVLWAIGWWAAAGVLEIDRVVPAAGASHALLTYALASAAAALALAPALRWPRLVWFAAALLPAMGAVGLVDWDDNGTTLLHYGWLLWPAAWLVHAAFLRATDRALAAPEVVVGPRLAWSVGALHATSAVAFVAWVAWEASEWTGRVSAPGSAWMPCAAVWPAVLYLVAMARLPADAPWPFSLHRHAYERSAATILATLACVWFVLANAFSPGGAPPLPYAPLANPLDLTLLAVVGTVFVWAQRTARGALRTRYAWLGIALFILVNAIVFRTVHQWLGVPWRFNALSGSKVLQAALTLTWTVTALPLMLVATRRAIRPLWMVGAALLALVVGKLFLVDLAALSGLTRIVAFIGVGLLLLVIGYLAPLPPAAAQRRPGA